MIILPYRFIPRLLGLMLKQWMPDNLAIGHLSILHRHYIEPSCSWHLYFQTNYMYINYEYLAVIYLQHLISCSNGCSQALKSIYKCTNNDDTYQYIRYPATDSSVIHARCSFMEIQSSLHLPMFTQEANLRFFNLLLDRLCFILTLYALFSSVIFLGTTSGYNWLTLLTQSWQKYFAWRFLLSASSRSFLVVAIFT